MTPREHTAQATAFHCLAPDFYNVFLAGTFNSWNATATPMVKGAHGAWDLKLDLPPGHHEFKFVVDGKWCCDPGCEKPHDGCLACVANSFGTMNRVIEVPQNEGVVRGAGDPKRT